MNRKNALPKYRFPEFANNSEWSIDTLGSFSDPIKKRAGTTKYTLMSVTSGIGLVTQIEKFGREIAGSAYKNYIVIEKNDFAYNKSATKLFPEGYVAKLNDHDEAALPNSIFTCFRITDEQICVNFIDHIFQSNYHGSWLRQFITVGARAHGSLNIDDKHLWEMPVALPSIEEQQKIADCLNSLDGLIAAEGEKLALLKTHKKGLMQKLFPAEGKTTPEWRFPEFRDRCDWRKSKLSSLATKVTAKNHDGRINRVLTNSAVGGIVEQSDFFDRKIVSQSNLKNYFIVDCEHYVYNPRISVTAPVGPISKNKIGAGIVSPLYTVFKFDVAQSDYFEHYFKSSIWHGYIREASNTGARHDRISISNENFMNMPIIFPSSFEEQQKISDCLSSVDDKVIVQTEKLETLKHHKKGLMQGLFPSAQEVFE